MVVDGHYILAKYFFGSVYPSVCLCQCNVSQLYVVSPAVVCEDLPFFCPSRQVCRIYAVGAPVWQVPLLSCVMWSWEWWLAERACSLMWTLDHNGHLIFITFPSFYLWQKWRLQFVSQNICTQIWLVIRTQKLLHEVKYLTLRPPGTLCV